MINLKTPRNMAGPAVWLGTLVLLLLALACAPVAAGIGGHDGKERGSHDKRSGQVIPADARVHGYSLNDMARITAAFNVSDRLGTVPNTPFQMLFSNSTNNNTFSVGQGRVLYVPVLYNDNSLPVIGNFPANAEKRRALLKYWYSQKEFGAVTTEIVVDGKVRSLGADYVASASFATPLADGATQYATAAAFITPLSPGVHTVEIRFKATGDALRDDVLAEYFPDGVFEFALTYTINVS
jgi:hypothetical protein